MSGLLINFRLSLLKFLLVSIHIFLMFSGKFVWKATERTIFLLQTDLCAAMRAFHLLFLLMKIDFYGWLYNPYIFYNSDTRHPDSSDTPDQPHQKSDENVPATESLTPE